MKRIPIRLAVAVMTGCIAFMTACVNVETRRIATIDRNEGSIYFEVSGFNTSPLTPEGPFPKWANDLKVMINPGREIPTTGKREFTAGTDFSTRYDAIESGSIVVDQDKKQIDVKVKYTKQYLWNRAKGLFPISGGKQ